MESLKRKEVLQANFKEGKRGTRRRSSFPRPEDCWGQEGGGVGGNFFSFGSPTSFFLAAYHSISCTDGLVLHLAWEFFSFSGTAFPIRPMILFSCVFWYGSPNLSFVILTSLPARAVSYLFRRSQGLQVWCVLFRASQVHVRESSSVRVQFTPNSISAFKPLDLQQLILLEHRAKSLRRPGLERPPELLPA